MKYKIPSISALKAFEASARLCNFSHAAKDLHTSQSAISRHIAMLESTLGVRLFNRINRKLTLTNAGDQYYKNVKASLESLHSASLEASRFTNPETLTIACTHEISHLFLMPRFDQIQRRVGQKVMIRVMTFEYEDSDTLLDTQIDIKLAYQLENDTDLKQRCIVLHESIAPVCSPNFFNKNKQVLLGSVTQWQALPFLNIARDNKGWATWDDWFEKTDNKLTPTYTSFYNYIYLLEAASSGAGIALGWKGLIERYIENDTLMTLTEKFLEFDRALYAGLTRQGKQREIAHQCLDVLSDTWGE